MSRVFRIMLAIATLMTAITTAGLAAYVLSLGKLDAFFVCMMLAFSFGVLTIIDYRELFGAGEDNGNDTKN